MQYTLDLINEYIKSGKDFAFGFVESHVDSTGDTWYIISVRSAALDTYLQNKCETEPEMYGECGIDKYKLPMYNIHGSIFAFLTLKYS